MEVEGAGMEDTAGRGLIAGHAYTLRRELKNYSLLLKKYEN